MLSQDELTNALGLLAEKEEIQRILRCLGTEAALHIVGGCIRDLAQGITGKDIDLASPLPTEEVIRKLKEHGIRVVETGVSHGTVLAVFDNNQLEITRFRAPSGRNAAKYSDSILTDLAGRDFTVNAIAFDIQQRKIIDPHDGLKDLHQKIIRTVGTAELRFREDPLRILRLFRFGPAAERTAHDDALSAARHLASTLHSVSVERIQQEFSQILISPNIAHTLRLMRETQVLDTILPEIVPTYDFEQNQYHIHDVFEHTLWVLERAPQELLIRLACLFHDIGKPKSLSIDEKGNRHFYKHELYGEEICRQAMVRLAYGKLLTRNTAILVRQHMRPLDCKAAGMRRIVRDLGELFDEWYEIKKADAPPVMPPEEFEQLLRNFQALRAIEQQRIVASQRSGLAINGKDLIALGHNEGPAIGAILKTLEEHILDFPEDNTKEILLAKARALQA